MSKTRRLFYIPNEYLELFRVKSSVPDLEKKCYKVSTVKFSPKRKTEMCRKNLGIDLEAKVEFYQYKDGFIEVELYDLIGTKYSHLNDSLKISEETETDNWSQIYFDDSSFIVRSFYRHQSTLISMEFEEPPGAAWENFEIPLLNNDKTGNFFLDSEKGFPLISSIISEKTNLSKKILNDPDFVEGIFLENDDENGVIKKKLYKEIDSHEINDILSSTRISYDDWVEMFGGYSAWCRTNFLRLPISMPFNVRVKISGKIKEELVLTIFLCYNNDKSKETIAFFEEKSERVFLNKSDFRVVSGEQLEKLKRTYDEAKKSRKNNQPTISTDLSSNSEEQNFFQKNWLGILLIGLVLLIVVVFFVIKGWKKWYNSKKVSQNK